jgi:hypothetical protein
VLSANSCEETVNKGNEEIRLRGKMGKKRCGDKKKLNLAQNYSNAILAGEEPLIMANGRISFAGW